MTSNDYHITNYDKNKSHRSLNTGNKYYKKIVELLMVFVRIVLGIPSWWHPEGATWANFVNKQMKTQQISCLTSLLEIWLAWTHHWFPANNNSVSIEHRNYKKIAKKRIFPAILNMSVKCCSSSYLLCLHVRYKS